MFQPKTVSHILMLREAFLISLGGGLVGIAMGALLVFSFSGLIEHAIGLPFLMPDLFAILLMAILTLLMVLIIGPVTSARSAWRLSHQDTGTILREGN